jgi:hypothetical protein
MKKIIYECDLCTWEIKSDRTGIGFIVKGRISMEPLVLSASDAHLCYTCLKCIREMDLRAHCALVHLGT